MKAGDILTFVFFFSLGLFTGWLLMLNQIQVLKRKLQTLRGIVETSQPTTSVPSDYSRLYQYKKFVIKIILQGSNDRTGLQNYKFLIYSNDMNSMFASEDGFTSSSLAYHYAKNYIYKNETNLKT